MPSLAGGVQLEGHADVCGDAVRDAGERIGPRSSWRDSQEARVDP